VQYKHQEQQLHHKYITKIYEGTTLNDNLRKHANAPKIPSQKHPHPKFSKLPRIKLKMLDPELKALEKLYNIKDDYNRPIDPEWFNKITVDDITCNCPHKDKFEQLFDKENNSEEAMCWTACRHTTLAAAKRQMKAAPTPDPAVADDFVQHSMQIIEQEMGEQLHTFGYSVNDWMKHLNSTKQKALEHVINYYKGNITNIPKKELSNILKMHYTGILKEELQPPDGKPRMVCSIPQRTKYIMGPITWALEEIAQDHLRGYCGGQNLTQMAEKVNHYLALGFTQIYEGDGSAFDNTQDVSLKQIDRNIYQMIEDKVYHVPKEDFHNVSQALYKTMDIEYIDGNKKKPLLTYKILGTVFSGDCDTTLMNTIRMVMYNRYVNDKAGLVYGRDYICFSKGDDFTLMYKPYVTKDFIHKAYYKYFLNSVPDPSQPNSMIYGIGQVLKFLEGGDASTIKFCSLRAWFTDLTETQIYLTRDVQKFMTLSKYSRKTKQYTIAQKIIYLQDIAESLIKNYPNIRFFKCIADMHLRLAEKLQKQTSITTGKLQMIRKKQELRNNKKILYVYDQQYFENLEKENQQNIKHRHTQFQIIDEYWETMKNYEQAHTDTLTEKQAKYVSELIEQEIMISYIKSMYDVGPKENY
jgi:hypothetical protein